MIKYKDTIKLLKKDFGTIKTIALNPKCQKYISTEKGIFKYIDDEFKIISDLNDVNCMAISESGKLVVASESKGLNIYPGEDTNQEPLFKIPEFRGTFCYSHYADELKGVDYSKDEKYGMFMDVFKTKEGNYDVHFLSKYWNEKIGWNDFDKSKRGDCVQFRRGLYKDREIFYFVDREAYLTENDEIRVYHKLHEGQPIPSYLTIQVKKIPIAIEAAPLNEESQFMIFTPYNCVPQYFKNNKKIVDIPERDINVKNLERNMCSSINYFGNTSKIKGYLVGFSEDDLNYIDFYELQ